MPPPPGSLPLLPYPPSILLHTTQVSKTCAISRPPRAFSTSYDPSTKAPCGSQSHTHPASPSPHRFHSFPPQSAPATQASSLFLQLARKAPPQGLWACWSLGGIALLYTPPLPLMGLLRPPFRSQLQGPSSESFPADAVWGLGPQPTPPLLLLPHTYQYLLAAEALHS